MCTCMSMITYSQANDCTELNTYMYAHIHSQSSACMGWLIHIHPHTHTCTRTHIHEQARARTQRDEQQTYMHIHTHTHTHTYTGQHAYRRHNTHKYICTYTGHTNTHIQTHTGQHAYPTRWATQQHTNTYVHTHIHKQANTRTRRNGQPNLPHEPATLSQSSLPRHSRLARQSDVPTEPCAWSQQSHSNTRDCGRAGCPGGVENRRQRPQGVFN